MWCLDYRWYLFEFIAKFYYFFVKYLIKINTRELNYIYVQKIIGFSLKKKNFLTATLQTNIASRYTQYNNDKKYIYIDIL